MEGYVDYDMDYDIDPYDGPDIECEKEYDEYGEDKPCPFTGAVISCDQMCDSCVYDYEEIAEWIRERLLELLGISE